MFKNLFKKKSRYQQLRKEYENLLERSFKLSSINRKESDRLAAEANKLMTEIEQLKRE